MEKLEIDLIGKISLTKKEDGGKEKALFHGYKGHGNVQGEKMQNSCIIYLVNKEKLFASESDEAELRFLFRDNEGFKICIKENQIFELHEGHRKIGEFEVYKIVNNKIIDTNCL